MKDIKKADKSDSESDYDRRLGREFSEDELSGDERDQMQGCILGAIKDFKHYFKYGVRNKPV
jgi:PHP family Zn ribbon phosphoesterase